MGRFQLFDLGVLGYGLDLRFWVVIEIIVSLTLSITLITTLYKYCNLALTPSQNPKLSLTLTPNFLVLTLTVKKTVNPKY